MRCPQGATESREGAHFCDACGTALTPLCPACGLGQRPGAQCCSACGPALDSGRLSVTAALLPPDPADPLPEPAYRHLPVLFCDIVGATALSGALDAIDETPNLAARQQSIATPQTVALSDATSRLVEGSVHCQPLGAHRLQGLATPMPVYQVLGESALQRRLDSSRQQGLTPLVGRAAEMALLGARWEQVQAGHGQIVLLSGEAGIGKSRLIRALQARLGEAAPHRIACRCSPYFHPLPPLSPVLATWKRQGHWAPQAAEAVKRAKLERTVQWFGLP